MTIKTAYRNSMREPISDLTPEEKALLQAKHRQEEAEARDRVKERKARTRRYTYTPKILSI